MFLASSIHYHQYQCPPCLNHTCFDCSKIQETRQICSLLTRKMGAKANFHHFRAKTCKAWLSCCPAASSRCHCSHPLLGPEIRYSGLRGAARCRKALSAGNTGCLLTWGRSCTLVTLLQLDHRRLLAYLNKKQRLVHLSLKKHAALHYWKRGALTSIVPHVVPFLGREAAPQCFFCHN